MLRQVYVGPDNEAVRVLREKKGRPTPSQKLRPLARSAAALGCVEILPKHARVLSRLSEYGLFRAGGVLVGNHAFLVIGNMLGARWVDSDDSGKSLSIALPSNITINTDAAITSLEMGFLPISSLNTAAGATYLNPREPEFRLDFLTTRHREGEKTYSHPQLGVNMQPLPFMEYSLRDVQQAGFLLSRLKELRPSDIAEAWRDLIGRGPGWRSRARNGVEALSRQFPELGAKELLGEAPGLAVSVTRKKKAVPVRRTVGARPRKKSHP
ncbi:MAG: hypothetical protein EBS65_06000 [Betaproteobacteria bacterium]|nr:hypothetical protein [Betaproteobacteria bacterium]